MAHRTFVLALLIAALTVAITAPAAPADAGVAVAVAIGRNAKASASTVYRPRSKAERRQLKRELKQKRWEERRARRIAIQQERARRRAAEHRRLMKTGRRSIFAWHWVPGITTRGSGLPNVTGISYGHLGTANNSVRGVDVGLFTYTRTTMSGLQVAQTANWVGGRAGGVQLAGAINKASILGGVQVAGGLNYAGAMHGWQIAGGANVAGSVSGVQLAPFNVAGSLRGIQLGVVNVVGRIDGGDAFGLFTFAGNGYNHLSLYSGGTDNLNLALTFGGKHLYTIIRAGVAAPMGQQGNPNWGEAVHSKGGHEDVHAAFRLGIGWGWHAQFGQRWYVDVDDTVGVRGEQDCECPDRVQLQFSNEARIILGFAPWRRLSIFTGLAVEATWGSATVRTEDRGRNGGEWQWNERDASDVNVTPRFVLGVRI